MDAFLDGLRAILGIHPDEISLLDNVAGWCVLIVLAAVLLLRFWFRP